MRHRNGERYPSGWAAGTAPRSGFSLSKVDFEAYLEPISWTSGQPFAGLVSYSKLLACKRVICTDSTYETYCRLPPVLLGSVMRRSCRLSTKQEHKLVQKAEADAAEAAAAEAALEGTSVYPSSVTKAIAGLATPSLPSPSMFPEDWRTVEELLHDGQVTNCNRAAKACTHTGY